MPAGCGGVGQLLAAACIVLMLQLSSADQQHVGALRRQLRQVGGGSSPYWWEEIVGRMTGSADVTPQSSSVATPTGETLTQAETDLQSTIQKAQNASAVETPPYPASLVLPPRVLTPAVRTGHSGQQTCKACAKSLEMEIQRASSISYPDAEPCRQTGDGGLLCGIPIGYENTNRSGYYYLPKTYKEKPLPVMILLHGSGVNGSWMLESLPFKEAADKSQVIVVMPDSRHDMYWFSPPSADSIFTADWLHIEACYKWFADKNPQDAKIDVSKVTIAGNSRAGYVAPAFCSRSAVVPCSGAVILHASVVAKEMGKRVIPILWTVGERDQLYGPDVTRKNLATFEGQAPQFPVTYSEWGSSHSLTKSQEIDYVTEWCGDPGFRGTPAPPLGSYRRS